MAATATFARVPTSPCVSRPEREPCNGISERRLALLDQGTSELGGSPRVVDQAAPLPRGAGLRAVEHEFAAASDGHAFAREGRRDASDARGEGFPDAVGQMAMLRCRKAVTLLVDTGGFETISLGSSTLEQVKPVFTGKTRRYAVGRGGKLEAREYSLARVELGPHALTDVVGAEYLFPSDQPPAVRGGYRASAFSVGFTCWSTTRTAR